jgi:coproporphyrinogen III oxidase
VAGLALQYGLEKATGVRVENVLMSLPLTARWEYRHPIVPGSEEDKLVQVLTNPVDWVGPAAGAASAGPKAGQ